MRALLAHLPGGIGGATAVAVSSSQIDLSWTDTADNEDGFELYRLDFSLRAWVELATLAANTTAYSDAALETSTRYWYRVRSFNTLSYSLFSSNANASTFAEDTPDLVLGWKTTRRDDGPPGR